MGLLERFHDAQLAPYLTLQTLLTLERVSAGDGELVAPALQGVAEVAESKGLAAQAMESLWRQRCKASQRSPSPRAWPRWLKEGRRRSYLRLFSGSTGRQGSMWRACPCRGSSPPSITGHITAAEVIR